MGDTFENQKAATEGNQAATQLSRKLFEDTLEGPPKRRHTHDANCLSSAEATTGKPNQLKPTDTTVTVKDSEGNPVAQRASRGHFVISDTWFGKDGKTPVKVQEYSRNIKDANDEMQAEQFPKRGVGLYLNTSDDQRRADAFREQGGRARQGYLQVPPIEGDKMKVWELDQTKNTWRSRELTIGNAIGMDLPGDPSRLIPESRRAQIDKIVHGLEDKVTRNSTDKPVYEGSGRYRSNTLTDGKIDFKEYGQVLNNIAQTKDLSEVEKTYAWMVLNHDAGSRYQISATHANPKTIDSVKGERDTGHSMLRAGPIDGYHVPMGNMTKEESDALILEHEQNEGSKSGFIAHTARRAYGALFLPNNINVGDVEASTNQAAAMRAYVKEGFAGYAREWNKGFVKD